jgi:hypothetical protein
MMAKPSLMTGLKPGGILRPELTLRICGLSSRPFIQHLKVLISPSSKSRLTRLAIAPVVLMSLSISGFSKNQPRVISSAHRQQSSATEQSKRAATSPMHQQQQAQTGNALNEEKPPSKEQGTAQASQESINQHDHDAMNQRGNTGMGFDQQKTTHHFRLLPDGGAIEVQANDTADTASRDQIRTHLGHIAQMFTDGNFSTPMFVHDQTPPGVETMKQLKEAIQYEYQETDRGGRVAISTKDPSAIEAIHSFLRFQIREHKTGDSLKVSNP